MHWYKVVKTVRGNRYLYLQHSYRIGGRKNPSTLNIYCGRADSNASWRRADDRKHERRPLPRPSDERVRRNLGARDTTLRVSELRLIDELLDMTRPMQSERGSGVAPRWDLRATKAKPWQHTEAFEIAARMGVTVKTLIGKGTGRMAGAPVYNIHSDSIALPDATRYRAGFGMTAEQQHHMAMLHETVHATMRRVGRPVPKNRQEYCREELVAEIGAWVVAFRLGTMPDCADGARYYLQGYWGRIPDRQETLAWVTREVAKAADYIVAHHSTTGWTPTQYVRNDGTRGERDDIPY